jgi:hypothetical protein
MSRLSSIKCVYASFVEHGLVGVCGCGYRSGQTNLLLQILEESIKSSISIADTITPKLLLCLCFHEHFELGTAPHRDPTKE